MAIFTYVTAQVVVLLLGCICAWIVCIFSSEELAQYGRFIEKAAEISYIATLIMPLFFFETILIPIIIIMSYWLFAFFQKDKTQTFFVLAPLSIFLVTPNQGAFLTTLCTFFIAVMLTTTIVFKSYVKKKKLLWNMEMAKKLVQIYKVYLIITVLLYAIMFVL